MPTADATPLIDGSQETSQSLHEREDSSASAPFLRGALSHATLPRYGVALGNSAGQRLVLGRDERTLLAERRIPIAMVNERVPGENLIGGADGQVKGFYWASRR